MWEAVGVPELDERLYEALVPRTRATVSELAEITGMTRDQAARILRRLMDRGLVTQLPGRPARYAAVTPELAASTLIEARERELDRLRNHAKALTDAHRGHSGSEHPAELIEVIEGTDNVRSAFVRVQRTARREVRAFDKPPYTTVPSANLEEYQLLATGRVSYRTVYDQAALTIPGRMVEIWAGIRQGERARVAATLPMKMGIADDRLALIPISTADVSVEAAYLVHPSSLLDALSELFEALWNHAIPLNQAPRAGEDGSSITERDAELIGLLAAGATDETIARTLGWSVRTVHRHVHRIMVSVGAETRFQAGMEAVRRGWV